MRSSDPVPNGDYVPTLDSLRTDIAELLGVSVDDVGPEDDLLSLGLDSLSVMRLARRWSGAGATVTFAELIESRTAADWHAVVSGSRSPIPNATPQPPVLYDRTGRSSDEGRVVRLTGVQRAYWFGRVDGQPLGGVGSHFYVEMEGQTLDASALQTAFEEVVSRHGMLRARFSTDGNQWVSKASAWSGIRVLDFRAVPEGKLEARLEATRTSMAHRRLDAGAGELFDVQLVLLPRDKSRLCLQIEMLVSDAQSFKMLLEEVSEVYRGGSVEPVGITFADYLDRVDEEGSRTLDLAREHWQERLPTMSSAGPALPYLRPLGAVSCHRTVQRDHWFNQQEAQALAAGGRAHGLTLTSVVLATYVASLARYSTSPRFLLTLPVYGRSSVHPDVERVVGDFTELLLLDVDVRPARPFPELAADLQEQLHLAAANSAFSGVDVLRELSRAAGEPVLAPVVFTSALGLGELFPDTVRQVLGDPLWQMSQNPQVALDLQLTERREGLNLHWDAAEGVLRDGVLDALFTDFVSRLATLVETADDWSAASAPDLPQESAAVRASTNDTGDLGSAAVRLLHDSLLEAAHRWPTTVALRCGADALTFGELVARAASAAARLRAAGVVRGDLVAVTLPRGVEQVVAVVAILMTGAAYVPIGIDLPPTRRVRTMNTAGVRLVVAADDLEVGELEVIRPAALFSDHGDPLADGAVGPAQPSDLAYVIYTSGSTGAPKGVEMTHAAAWNTCLDVNRRFGVGPGDAVLGLSALDFDLSVYDVFGVLGAGACLVLVPEADRRDPERWLDLAAEARVSLWNSVPTLLDVALSAQEARPNGRPDGLGALRLVLVSGDWVALDLPDRVRRHVPACRFVALGGATEAAIWSIVQEVHDVDPEWTSIPYGRPLTGQRFRAVDEQGNDRPDGVAGELWIGGAGVAQGYRGDTELSSHKFPVVAGERWYRTGDMGCYWPDGTLQFLGRRDLQVKVRGHRVELSEVETAMSSHPAVRRAVVVVVGARPHLAAALTTVPGTRTSPESLVVEVRHHLLDQLPYHMVPDLIQVVDELPQTANGKIDRTAVAADLGTSATALVHTSPGDPAVVALLAGLWQDLLGLPSPATPSENFFHLGGDSLSATRMLGRLTMVGVQGGDLRLLLRHPVLDDFAATLTPGRRPDVTSLHHAAEALEPFAPTPAQWAYWLGRQGSFSLGRVGTNWYWEFDGVDVDLDRLGRAFNRVISRHGMLRAVFDDDGRQRVLGQVPPLVIHHEHDADLSSLSALRAAVSHRIGDPTRWPLLEVRALTHSEDRTRLFVRFDYLVVDALSISTVLDEVSVLYDDPEADLARPGISFRDYLAAATPGPAERAEARNYWEARLPTLPSAPRLPLARDPSSLEAPRFVRREAVVPAPVWSAVVEESRRHGLTPAGVLLTAYAAVLAGWSESPELTINLTLFDRAPVHTDVERVVGDFTSLVLLPSRTPPGAPFLDAALELQAELWGSVQHRAVGALDLMRELARHSDLPTAQMPVVFTSALGISSSIIGQSYPFGAQVHGVSQTPQVWLDNQVTERDGALVCAWDSVEGLLEPSVLDAMFNQYLTSLHELAHAAAQNDGWARYAIHATDAAAVAHDQAVRLSQRAQRVSSPGTAFKAPTTPGEVLLTTVWQQTLALADAPGVDDNFFSLGGDSLSAARMLKELQASHGIEVTFRQLVAQPTVSGLVSALGTASLKADDVEEGAL